MRKPAKLPVVTVSLPAEEDREVVTFPCYVPDTTVMVEEMVLYDGPFLGKCGEEPVSDIAALMVRNTGSQDLLFASILLETEDGQLVFQGNYLPAGGRVILLEQSGAPWKDYRSTNCSGTAVPTQSSSAEDILVEEKGDDVLCVTNTSTLHRENIRIYYKNYLPDADVYVGGVTYCAKIAALAPGESILLTCNHYLSGYSRVVRIENE